MQAFSERIITQSRCVKRCSLELGYKDVTEKLGLYIIKEAGLRASEVDKLQQMPWKEYYALATGLRR
jgi:para-nitrobenzyl esterase